MFILCASDFPHSFDDFLTANLTNLSIMASSDMNKYAWCIQISVNFILCVKCNIILISHLLIHLISLSHSKMLAKLENFEDNISIDSIKLGLTLKTYFDHGSI